MKARILFITDLHKRHTDSVSIKGQVEAARLVQKDLIELNHKYNITHNVICGDWYHRGFHKISTAFGAIQEDRALSESVNGEVYLVIGNHFYLERDNNPEMYIIQPNKDYVPKDKITIPDKPIFKCVDKLVIGTTQISFFHFSKVNKNYRTELDPNIKFHIGVYHDDCCVPGWVREKEGYLIGHVSTQYLLNIYQNIDLAIIGHIHTDIGTTTINLADKRVPMFIPGALGITQNVDTQKHAFVNLPMIDIEDDDSVKIRQLKVSTHMECMIFREVKSATDVNPIQAADAMADKSLVAQNLASLPEYLRSRGYDDISLDVVKTASHTEMTTNDLIQTLEAHANVNTGIAATAAN